MLKPIFATTLCATVAWTSIASAHGTAPTLQPTMSAQNLEADMMDDDRDGTAFFVLFGIAMFLFAVIDRGGAGAAAGGGAQLSDERLKTDIRRVGQTADGLPIYDYRYIGLPGLYRGVMAQDVLNHRPEAVLRDERGFYLVDYDMLGLTLQRVD